MKIVPPSRPQIKRRDVIAAIPPDVLARDHVVVVGYRGYYKDTMGVPGVNDRGIYDDALCIVENPVLPTGASGDIIESGFFGTYNANTDPSASDKQKHNVAVLRPGAHPYRIGNHGISRPGGGYPAFRPATKDEGLPVTRSGKPTIGIAINIHKGGYNGTSSLGCQTIYPDQWSSFQSTLTMLLKRYGQKTFQYILVA